MLETGELVQMRDEWNQPSIAASQLGGHCPSQLGAKEFLERFPENHPALGCWDSRILK